MRLCYDRVCVLEEIQSVSAESPVSGTLTDCIILKSQLLTGDHVINAYTLTNQLEMMSKDVRKGS